MATADATIDLSELLATEDASLEAFHHARREVHCSIQMRSEMERIAEDFSAIARKLSSENKAETRKAVALWLLGRVEEAAALLEPARASKEKFYFLGISLLDEGRVHQAFEALQSAHAADSDDRCIALALWEARIKTDRIEEAETQRERLAKKYADDAEFHYVRGLLLDAQGLRDKAVEAYEKALALEPGHPRSLFRVAYHLDMAGEDKKAMELYEQLRRMRPIHVNLMINLGVLYEDRGDPAKAAACYHAILDYFPNHRRAKLYLRDAEASQNMFYDEDAARRKARMQQMLQQKVAEITFSPRVRKAVDKLGIQTLGDLVARTEEQLLQVPNFGRTSLRELKEFLTGRGLTLASGSEPESAAAPEAGDASPEALQKPLAEFEWSGRIRKVFEKMGLATVDDLMKKTEQELLKAKNLGMTSIREVRKGLATVGVRMREE